MSAETDKKATDRCKGILSAAERTLLTLTEDGAHAQSGLHVAFLWGLTVADRYILTDDYAEAVSRTCDNPEGLPSLMSTAVTKSFERFLDDPSLMIIPIRGRRRLIDKCPPIKKTRKKKPVGGLPDKVGDEHDWMAILSFCPDGNPDGRTLLFAWGDDKFGYVASWALHLRMDKVRSLAEPGSLKLTEYGDITEAFSMNDCLNFSHDRSFDLYGKDGVPEHEQRAIMMTELPYYLCAGAGVGCLGTRLVAGDTSGDSLGKDSPANSKFILASEALKSAHSPTFVEKRALMRRKVLWQ